MKIANRALGAVIKKHREAAGLSQERLGVRAGYGAGAGVSISRIESGETRPRKERLRKIASVLGVSLEKLEEEAARDPLNSEQVPTERDLKAEFHQLNQDIETRAEQVRAAGEDYTHAHAKAFVHFVQEFFQAASEIRNAELFEWQTPDQIVKTSNAEAVGTEESVRAARLGIAEALRATSAAVAGGTAGAAAGGAAAAATFTIVASAGTASTGAAISSLTGVAAYNATMAAIGGGALAAGGAGMAGGAAVLASLVAGPAALAGVAGIALYLRRNAQKRRAEMLDKVESLRRDFRSKETAVKYLLQDLEEATIVLEYVATHGAHALKRWIKGLGELPKDWADMDAADQESYGHFLTIAAYVNRIEAIPFEAYLTVANDSVESVHVASRELLTMARSHIEELV